MLNVVPVEHGKLTRMSFGKINEVMDMPNLIEVQKDSYQWFLDVGLREVFRDIAEIKDYTGNWVLTFVDYYLDDKPKANDTFSFGGDKYTVVDVQPFMPDGNTTIYYIVQGR